MRPMGGRFQTWIQERRALRFAFFARVLKPGGPGRWGRGGKRRRAHASTASATRLVYFNCSLASSLDPAAAPNWQVGALTLPASCSHAVWAKKLRAARKRWRARASAWYTAAAGSRPPRASSTAPLARPRLAGRQPTGDGDGVRVWGWVVG